MPNSGYHLADPKKLFNENRWISELCIDMHPPNSSYFEMQTLKNGGRTTKTTVNDLGKDGFRFQVSDGSGAKH